MPQPDNEYLTPKELAARWKGVVAEGTLLNWRIKRIGPRYIKVGRSVLYPLAEVQEYEKHSLQDTYKAE